MPLVKLDATASTNDFLKEMAANPSVENFTVVTAESQSAGRGQMGARWDSEPGKNLMMSVLIKDLFADANLLFGLNVAVALAVAETIETHDIPRVSIKWPNDILSGATKIGGILIENSIKADGKITSVAGIGLNVNQNDFAGLPKAGSMQSVTGRIFDKEHLRDQIVERIVRNVHFLSEHADVLWEAYHRQLFKKDVPMAFEANGNRFMGIIEKVTREGKLVVRLEDEKRQEFAVKEVQMLY